MSPPSVPWHVPHSVDACRSWAKGRDRSRAVPASVTVRIAVAAGRSGASSWQRVQGSGRSGSWWQAMHSDGDGRLPPVPVLAWQAEHRTDAWVPWPGGR